MAKGEGFRWRDIMSNLSNEELAVLKSLLAKVSGDDVAEDVQATPKRRRRQSKVASAATQAANRGQASASKGVKPGVAPSLVDGNKMPMAAETHQARLDALEDAIPGILKVALVKSVGRNAKNKNTTSFGAMVNNPWTYVELPGGRYSKIGKMKGEDVAAEMWKLGYKFLRKQGVWATSSNGNTPQNRGRNYKSQNVGRWAMDNE